MSAAEKHTVETITWLHGWTTKLFSFRTTRNRAFRFTPGQFARLGVQKADGSIVWRAYSMVSANYDDFLEFYSIVVPDGEFTSELARLKVGDALLVDKTSYGFLTTARFQGGKDLWMLSTGTGLAPYLSILGSLETWENYDHLIVVHGVREANELAYRESIAAFATSEVFAAFGPKLKYIPIVTREPAPDMLHARITTLISDGRLEAAAGLKLDLDRSRIMLCGNPEMVSDTRKLLKQLGFATSRSTKPGQIAVENYW
jgi:ferredoxin--NADP+ reductase